MRHRFVPLLLGLALTVGVVGGTSIPAQASNSKSSVIYVTNDGTCPINPVQVNKFYGLTIYVASNVSWLGGQLWAIYNNNLKRKTTLGSLTLLCTLGGGLSLYLTGFSSSSLSNNTGSGSKTQVSYTLWVPKGGTSGLKIASNAFLRA
jgi:hypothetical protein